MPVAGFGCSVDEARDLGEVLATVADAGFTHAEIRPRGWDLWANGDVNRRELVRYAGVLERFGDGLSYTLHGPYDLNLFDGDSRQRRLLRAGVEVGREVGATAVVIHPGRMERESSVLGSPIAELMARERDALLDIFEQVSDWHGSLAIETWYAVGDVAYSYAIWPQQLASQVESAAHPQIGVCLDLGHLQLAARWFGFDFREGALQLAPVAAHVHVHENFGILTRDARKELGHGDLHMPPGWGSLALDEVFADATFSRAPVLNVEVSASHHRPHLESILAACRRLASCADPAVAGSERGSNAPRSQKWH